MELPRTQSCRFIMPVYTLESFLDRPENTRDEYEMCIKENTAKTDRSELAEARMVR